MHFATINGKPWTRAKEVCKALRHEKAAKRVVRHHCTRENIQHKHQLAVVPRANTTVNWPRDSQNYDEEGMYKLLFSSQQPKAKAFRKHFCNVLFPHVRQQLSDKLHAMEIEDLTSRVQALEFNNEEECQAHPQEILRFNEEIDDLIANRYIARHGCFYTVLCFIKKNSREVHPYYVIRCQYKQLA